MKLGYCNCSHDRYNKGELYEGTSFEIVRVDINGLCYLCANTALIGKPPKMLRSHHDHWKDRADVTVSIDRPEGILNHVK